MPKPVPETRYALSGDINIAYQVFGDGPVDLVIVPGFISHVDLHWQQLGFREWMERLASFARVIVFDKRGTGASDRDVGDSTLEERMDDIRAVLDAAGSKRAAVFGFSEGGALGILLAAACPERVSELILFATFPCCHENPDFPEDPAGRSPFDRVQPVLDAWGQGDLIRLTVPSLAAIPAARAAMGQFERASSSPRAVRSHMRWVRDIDIRPVAKSLRVRTLVGLRTGDALVPPESTRWLARNIPGARLVEYPGDAHLPWIGDFSELANDIEEFVTGARRSIVAEPDRVLATVLFTDIVRSTERAVSLGDRAWTELLGRHHEVVRSTLARFRGREEGTTGDGFLATFDGPARAVRCALAIRDALAPLRVEVRAGVHTGECERNGDDLAGIAVHTGARVMAAAEPGEVLVSRVVRDLVAGSGLTFDERGTHTLKGIPGQWELYRAGAS
jgi:class 3 adenylate cyclase/pimeloyl-ACP methyl ester carboxylesterase